jgi:hypothetical protein
MTARGDYPQADHRSPHDTPDCVRRCSKGHVKNQNHEALVRLNMRTTAAEWAEAARLGYVEDRRWDGRERRHS